MRVAILALIFTGLLAPSASASPAAAPLVGSARSVCAGYRTQADAQRAADTVDADGDGIYCESLPCPCLKPGAEDGTERPDGSAKGRSESSCSHPSSVQSISFSATKYPNIKRHAERAIRSGWPRTLVLNRPGADARRARLLETFQTRAGKDRDEYPPAVGRGRGAGLTGGSDPRGWKADVAYVPSSENRSHGSTLGTKLRRFCDGTKFRYVFY